MGKRVVQTSIIHHGRDTQCYYEVSKSERKHLRKKKENIYIYTYIYIHHNELQNFHSTTANENFHIILLLGPTIQRT